MTDSGPGPGRWIDVPPERFPRWVEGFAARHGVLTARPGAGGAVFRAADGAEADCRVPFPPLPPEATRRGAAAGQPGGPGPAAGGAAAGSAAAGGDRGGEGSSGGGDQAGAAGGGQGGPAAGGDHGGEGSGGGDEAGLAMRVACVMAAHAAADRTVAVVLVRLGGYAAGVFTGSPPVLAASKTGSRLVHGRSAAGGWSQQRFARRRQQQAAGAVSAAADTAVRVLAPYAGRLDAVVLGGDRRAAAGLREDPRLRPYLELAVERFLTVPDPRLAVLRDSPRLFRSLRVRVSEPG